jgi:GAF domain-containing protein
MANPQVRALARLVTRMQSEADQDTTARAALDQVLTLVGDTEHASLTLRVRGGRTTTLASTDPRATRADDLQHTLDEGPGVTTALGHEWIRSGDVAHDRRWPRWGPQAAALGIGSALSLPLQADDGPFGSLSLYSSATGCFADEDDLDFALLYAANLSAALTSSRRIGGLAAALRTRHVIGAAQGILIERFGLDLDRSFALLRRYSSEHQVKVRDLAERIVATGRLPEEPAGPEPASEPGPESRSEAEACG